MTTTTTRKPSDHVDDGDDDSDDDGEGNADEDERSGCEAYQKKLHTPDTFFALQQFPSVMVERETTESAP